jgi:DNA-binding NarL/FixJ family response regulator
VPSWTPEEVETLRALAEAGASQTRIAARLNRSLSAIRITARKLGIALKSTKEIRKNNGLSARWTENRDF